jgi:hypothetical protein
MKIASAKRMVIRMAKYFVSSIRWRCCFPQAAAKSACAGARAGSTLAASGSKDASQCALIYSGIQNEDPAAGRGIRPFARNQTTASTAPGARRACPRK